MQVGDVIMIPITMFDELGKPVKKGFVPAEVQAIDNRAITVKEIESDRVYEIRKPSELEKAARWD